VPFRNVVRYCIIRTGLAALMAFSGSSSGWMSGSTFVGLSAVRSSTRYQNDRRDPTCIEDKNAAKAVAIGSGSVIIL
jgi:hypothetical protein